MGAGVPLRARYKANWKALKMNLPSWLDHVVKLLSVKNYRSISFSCLMRGYSPPCLPCLKFPEVKKHNNKNW